MASDFIAFGKSSVCASHVTHAEWVSTGPTPKIVVATDSGGAVTLLADDPDAEKAAKAVGLGDHYEAWMKPIKDAEKAAKAHADEVAKHEAKVAADLAKAEKAEHAHK